VNSAAEGRDQTGLWIEVASVIGSSPHIDFGSRQPEQAAEEPGLKL
jgi:hypothetical protein